MYALAKKALFLLNPELAHEVSLDMMSAAERLRLLSLFFPKPIHNPTTFMGIEFPNRVGLAAGMDKNGDHFNALGALGFGCVEIGTVTPKPQDGNPSPRLFRLVEDEAIINRMGFNNKGVDYLVERVKNRRFDGVLGINIGKNKDTPEDRALEDYEICLEKVYAYADYITVNISSPNTPGLRNLQFGDAFDSLLAGIKIKQKALADEHSKYVPIVIKVAPDNSSEQIQSIAATLKTHNIDGLIVSNTTISREGLHSEHSEEMGGLSGRPLLEKANESLDEYRKALGEDFPIIGVGGISTAEDGETKMSLGADLVQIYTGFIYHGPGLVRRLAEAL
ncbi:MAG: dihydroorotate dehydrogenase [Flavobacteriales bacterium]|jgi:dihydroorotate dehydrogenase